MTVDRMTVLSAMIDQGVIPVFYHPDVEVCTKVIQACADGGGEMHRVHQSRRVRRACVLRGQRATSPRPTRA